GARAERGMGARGRGAPGTGRAGGRRRRGLPPPPASAAPQPLGVGGRAHAPRGPPLLALPVRPLRPREPLGGARHLSGGCRRPPRGRRARRARSTVLRSPSPPAPPPPTPPPPRPGPVLRLCRRPPPRPAPSRPAALRGRVHPGADLELHPPAREVPGARRARPRCPRRRRDGGTGQPGPDADGAPPDPGAP